MEEVPGRSTLAENIKKVRAETLEEINRELLRYDGGLPRCTQPTCLAIDSNTEIGAWRPT